MKNSFLLFTLVCMALSSEAQYRELIYFKVPVGEIKYFRLNDDVIFRLKSEDRFQAHDGTISFLSDTIYEIRKIRFHPDNLLWISTPLSSGKRFLRALGGSVLIAGGGVLCAYGISKFPNDALKNEDSGRYNSESAKALTILAGGVLTALVSVPVLSIHSRRYAVSRKWKIKYQR